MKIFVVVARETEKSGLMSKSNKTIDFSEDPWFSVDVKQHTIGVDSR